ncbi:hypothetical protein NGM67_10620 [Photobacterium damselae]|uniref:hypothetical protein n=1 Tax=Photobacterium damselae TaxID=38293 RepID=UPI0020902FBF|nr:hypothetical protein [Photobacterium damselae]USR78201.1 hypothetical protein NGM67_10620 [Photobacterium damselae]
MNRKQALQIFGHLYKKAYPMIKEERCQYCGYGINLSDDHIPAITTAHLYVRNPQAKFLLIKCCQSCNSSLSNRLIPTFEERFFFIKDNLLIKNKKKLKNEYRTSINSSADYFEQCDIDFNIMLDRIAFGLLKFSELSNEAQKVLEIEIESYGENLGTVIASRFSGLFYEGEERDYGSGTEATYRIFLQFINYFNITDKESFEFQYKEYHDTFLDYGIPEKPIEHFLHSWGQIVKESKYVKMEIDFSELLKDYFCSLEEFLEFASDYDIYNQDSYNLWYERNINGLVYSLMLPEKPTEIFSVDWSEISKAVDEIKSAILDQEEDEEDEDWML